MTSDAMEETDRFAALYVSGSAYKIVNKRAYHHGTMLISTKARHTWGFAPFRQGKQGFIYSSFIRQYNRGVLGYDDHQRRSIRSFASLQSAAI
jgi:hypothetical protein